MKSLLPVLATFLIAGGTGGSWVERLAFWSAGDLRRLDERLAVVRQTLPTLPEIAVVNSSIRVGLKTGYTTADDVRWLELTLPAASLVDTVVLVPPLAKAATAVMPGYGFPLRFQLEIFDGGDHGRVILDKTQEDFPNPGCFPVVARFDRCSVKRVRLTATVPWSADGPDVLALAEMLVLSGNLNLALDAKVTSSSSRNAPRAWTRPNLVDMVTPLGLPVVRQAGASPGFHSAVARRADEVKTLTLALPEAVDLDEVRLVPVRRPEVPLWFDYGFPVLYRLEAATEADFSDARVVHEVTDKGQPTPGMNLVCIPVHGVRARYLRLTTKQLWENRGSFVFALAEFQAYSGGVNIAPKGVFAASDALGDDPAWSLAALNDGLTGEGRLVELPAWFAGLERRQALEAERDRLTAARAALVENAEHALVMISIGSVAGISLLSIGMLWRQRRNRLRDTERLRERLARDLHDEIGSNLGSIRLICSFAGQADITMETLRSDLADIERVAAESADSMRDMVRLISPRQADEGRGWLEVLQGLTERLLRGHKLDCLLPTEPLNHEPDIETRREIYLFCKEVLHNIARHAQATQVRFHLSPAAGGLRIEIADNGAGFDPEQQAGGHGLGNLRQRARALHAKLNLASQPGEGTQIALEVPGSRRWRKQ